MDGAMASLEEADREAALYTLAARLQFKVERDGGRFTLTRTAGVSRRCARRTSH
jgi:hypothetical protein